MVRTRWIFLIVVVFLMGSSWSQAVFAEENDYVLEVDVCEEDLLIKMQIAGWVVARASDIDDNDFALMFNKALYLNKKKLPTGFFDPDNPIDFCGYNNVRPITVLEINEEIKIE